MELQQAAATASIIQALAAMLAIPSLIVAILALRSTSATKLASSQGIKLKKVKAKGDVRQDVGQEVATGDSNVTLQGVDVAAVKGENTEQKVNQKIIGNEAHHGNGAEK
jgi:hypothetical protein